MTNYKHIAVAKKIRIDLVSDVVCPWCIVGYKSLEKAISEMGIQDQIELEWQPFELNPQMPAEGENVQEHIIRKYGSSPEESKRQHDYMTQRGADLGFRFNYYDEMRIVNTRDAHILLDYAKQNGKQTELNLCLVAAVFSEKKDISNRKILIQALESVSLNVDEAMAKLVDDQAREDIQNQEKYWTSRGISAVPTMVFNGTSALSGAQSVAVYKQVLAELLEQ
ncbi:MAG: DsbA family oxidoreductase [Prolixibacteraceae bacterium]